MSGVRIYHNPRCSKSRQALQLLNDQQVDVQVIDYLKQAPGREQLATLCEQIGCRPQDLLRRGEELYKQQYQERELSDDETLDALVAYPSLLQRPIVVGPGGAVIARPPEKATDVLD